MVKNLVLVIALLSPFTLLAQTGIVKGKVTDKTSGEELLAANVYVKSDVTKGTVTDLFGSYQLTLPVGTYTLVASYIGYQELEIENVVVKSGEITEIYFELSDAAIGLNEVVIDAKKVENTEMSILADRKKSYTVNDGISSQEISRAGYQDASQAVKQITGASVEDGKYMVVRGLGDRYSITQLNGVTLPSTDPYRNSASLDLIPSFMLDNIITSKTFSPDQPGNFTGGNMNIKTKAFPEKFFLNFGVRGAYNSISSFKNDFLTTDGGNTTLPDYLRSPETRAVLGSQGYKDATYGNKDAAATINQSVQDLNTPLLPVATKSYMDHNVSLSFGDMIRVKGKNPFGYVFGLRYSQTYNAYQNGNYNLWEANKTSMLDKFKMTDSRGDIGTNLGSFLSLSYQMAKNHEISINGMYNNDQNVMGRYQTGNINELGNAHLYRARTMGVTNRNLKNIQLRGQHAFPSLRGARLEWVAGYTQSSQNQPDLRFFSDHLTYYFDDVQGNEQARINKSNYDMPAHYYRFLTDNQYDFKVDFKQPYGTRSGSHLKFGVSGSFKDRVFNEYRYSIYKEPKPTDDLSTNWSDYLSAFGVVPNGSRFTVLNFYQDETRPSNQYTGHQNFMGAYGMVVDNLTPKLKFVGGLRVETTDILVVSGDTSSSANVGRIKTVNPLPSVNLIYALTNKSNLRFSASQTIARPNMREMAPFASFDFIGGLVYVGNPNLNKTLIQNVDLRWELYNKPGEMISVSGYFKNFNDAIFKEYNAISSTGEISFVNIKNTIVYGAEFEWRKSLDFLSESLKNFKMSTNLSYIYSQVKIPEKDLESAKQNNLVTKDTRPFQGQSPYLVNAVLTYINDTFHIESALTFNVFGKRLYSIGSTGNPDIYELPRPFLNYNLTKTFNERIRVRVGVSNILGSKFRTMQFYKSKNPVTGEVNEQDFIVQQYQLGRTYSLTINYQIR